MKKKTQFQRVQKLALDRIKESLAAGMTMKKGSWATRSWSGGNSGTRCAVGAIAFDGMKLRTGATWERTFSLAAKQLRSVGVPDDQIGGILDAISSGFELDMDSEGRIPRFFTRRQNVWDDYYSLDRKMRPYYRLGRKLRHRFLHGEKGVRFS
jgi:hypothetical protein